MNINHGGVRFRKEGALKRLQAQLTSGQKTPKGYVTGSGYFVLLSDADKKRIEKEIAILKERI